MVIVGSHGTSRQKLRISKHKQLPVNWKSLDSLQESKNSLMKNCHMISRLEIMQQATLSLKLYMIH